MLGSRIDGGVPVIPVRERKTVQALKEIARNHSDAEIYAMLKDSNMDPDETAQKLLNQDPFHEVRRKKDKKKENVGTRIPAEPWKQLELNHSPPFRNNIYVTVDRNSRRGFYPRSQLSGGNHEFRVVRDNRVNNSNSELKKNTYNIADDSHMSKSSPDKRSSEILTTSKIHTVRGLDNKSQPAGTGRIPSADAHAKSSLLVGPHNNMSEREKSTLSNPTVQPPNDSTRISEMLPSPASSSSAIGVYSSSSDPVHVPSPVPRSVGTVGGSRREVGVVGKRSTPQSSLPNGTTVSANGKDATAPSNSFPQTATASKSTHTSQTSSSDHTVAVSVGRPSSNSSHGNKQMMQQSMGHQKASTSNMEWKPKVKASRSDTPGTCVPASVSGSGVSLGDNTVNPECEVSCLADKLCEAGMDENKLVIIPSHLRVPETERAHVTFGSFGKEDADIPSEQAVSIPSGPVEPPHVTLSEDNSDSAGSLTATSSLDSPPPTADSGTIAPDNASESMNSQHLESYADVGLVHDHSPQHPMETHQMQPESDLSSVPAYSLSQNYETPFFRPTSEDNSGMQELSSPPETLTAYVANSTPSPTGLASAMSHHQPSMQQQQPPATQLYPHVQFSHFQNFLPYRQFMPPMYVPQIAVPNYPSSPAYPHPSNGSSYLLMPGASSHIAANGLKYKPGPLANPTAYGAFTNPAGYTISSAGALLGGASSLDDISRIKYKDNNLYVPNVQQAESPSEMWVQTPRDLPGVQSSHYFNIAGQASHAAYLPTHAAHASFNAAVQPSHIQFPGLFHPSQQTAMPNPHHLVHQQVPPSMGGNIAVGMASPTAPIASFQQAQLGHSWPGNF